MTTPPTASSTLAQRASTPARNSAMPKTQAADEVGEVLDLDDGREPMSPTGEPPVVAAITSLT